MCRDHSIHVNDGFCGYLVYASSFLTVFICLNDIAPKPLQADGLCVNLLYVALVIVN